MALPMWGPPMKDEQEGNPKTHDMAIPVLAGGGGRWASRLPLNCVCNVELLDEVSCDYKCVNGWNDVMWYWIEMMLRGVLDGMILRELVELMLGAVLSGIDDVCEGGC